MKDTTVFVYIADCLTPSLVPVKPFNKHNKVPPVLEVQEFNQACPEAAYPHTTYVNNLYVYPIFLNYSNQKTYHKVKYCILLAKNYFF